MTDFTNSNYINLTNLFKFSLTETTKILKTFTETADSGV